MKFSLSNCSRINHVNNVPQRLIVFLPALKVSSRAFVFVDVIKFGVYRIQEDLFDNIEIVPVSVNYFRSVEDIVSEIIAEFHLIKGELGAASWDVEEVTIGYASLE